MSYYKKKLNPIRSVPSNASNRNNAIDRFVASSSFNVLRILISRNFTCSPNCTCPLMRGPPRQPNN